MSSVPSSDRRPIAGRWPAISLAAVIGLASCSQDPTLQVPPKPLRAFRILADPTNGRLYVAFRDDSDFLESLLTTLDTETGEVNQVHDLNGSGFALALDPETHRIYASVYTQSGEETPFWLTVDGDGKEEAVVRPAEDGYSIAIFDADSRRLFAAGEQVEDRGAGRPVLADQGLAVIHPDSLKVEGWFNTQGGVWDAVVHRAQRRLFVLGEKALQVMDIRTRRLIRRAELKNVFPIHVAVNQQTGRAYVIDRDAFIHVLDPDGKLRRVTLEGIGPRDVAVAPDGSRVYIVYGHGELVGLDPVTLNRETTIGLAGELVDLEVSGSDRLYALNASGTVFVIDPKTGRIVNEFDLAPSIATMKPIVARLPTDSSSPSPTG